jgi:hypothetical protein
LSNISKPLVRTNSLLAVLAPITVKLSISPNQSLEVTVLRTIFFQIDISSLYYPFGWYSA